LVALVILAYRAAGGGGGASPDTMVSREAPDFTLPTLDGQQVTLSDFRGDTNVLLFFNEGYGCDPCWQQALALQQSLDQYTDMETEVFAVMVDPPDLLAREASRWGITLPILVDVTTGVSQSYDALGGMHANKPNHTFVLIDKEGKIGWAQDYPSMRVDNESVVRQVQSVTRQ
jgi:peroxiredoxin